MTATPMSAEQQAELGAIANGEEPQSVEQRLRDRRVVEDGSTFFADRGPAEPAFLVDELWTQGAVGWIAGEPKTGKTWLALELIKAITAGRPAMGRFACKAPGRVLYVGEEGNRARFQDRLAGLCNATDSISLSEDVLPRLDVIWRQHVDLLDTTWQRDLLAIAATYQFICLDPFRDMHDRDEDRVHEIKPVLDYLRQLQEQGPAVGAVMHLRKQRDGDKNIRAGQRVAGSRHFHSFLDCALYLDPDKADHDWPVKVTVEHRDHEAIDPFHIELEADGNAERPDYRLRAELAADHYRDRQDTLRANAVTAAREMGPTSKNKLATALHINKKVALIVVGDCLDRGLLIRSDDGRAVLAPGTVPQPPEPVGTSRLTDAPTPHRSGQ